MRPPPFAMRMQAALFRAYARLGEREQAAACFGAYYSNVKDICGNLPDADYVQDYISHHEFTGMVEAFKGLNAENPGR